MTFNVPKNFLGKPVDGALEHILSKKSPASQPVAPVTRTARSSVSVPKPSDPASWIILEGRSHGKKQYGDLYVAMHRLSYNSDVEKAALDLGISGLGNTATEKDGTPYLGNINWNSALLINCALGNRTLSPRQFMDFLEDLRSGIKGSKKLYDGSGAEVDPDVLKKVYEEIWGKRDPWRSEWLDAEFRDVNGTLTMEYAHRFNSQTRRLEADEKEPLEICLGEDCYVNMDTLNGQGLPTQKSRKQTLYFWSPAHGKVARFNADSGGAGLSCGWGPRVSYSALGVRSVREKN